MRIALLAVLIAGCGNTSMSSPDAAVARDMSQGAVDLAGADLTTQTACDPLKQDCTDAINTKCTAVDDGGGGVAAMCVMPTGSTKTGDLCTRINGMASGEGMDNCADGNYCSGLGSLANPPVRHCRAFCLLDGDCQANQHCSQLIAQPAIGLCIPVCTPFGGDCAQGFDCSNVIADGDRANYFLGCRELGNSATGGPCASDSDCVAGNICIGNTMAKCSPLCDMSHPCANGMTCMPITPGSTFSLCE
jgi:hypothetical protein